MQMIIPGHSNEQSLVSYNKRLSYEHLMECSGIVSQTQSLSFRVPSSHFMNTQSQLRQNFPVNQRRADEYVQLKVCSVAVTLVL